MRDFLIHFSDLHFGDSILDFKAKKQNSIYIALKKASHFAQGKLLCETHSLKPLKALKRSLNIIMSNKNIDLNNDLLAIALTGDISSYISSATVLDNFPYQFIRSTIPYRGSQIGLRFSKVPLLAAIGNHDKLQLGHVPDGWLNSKFADICSNSICLETAKFDYVTIIRSKNLNRLYVFYCFDSNYYMRQNIANGDFSEEQAQWFENRNDEISSSHGYDYEGKKYFQNKNQIISIALLHHPPSIVPEAIDSWTKRRVERYMTYLGNSTKILKDRVLSKVDITLCGHYHVPFFVKSDRISAAGSVSEWNNDDNYSFNVIEFFKNDCCIIEYRYKNGIFCSNSTETMKYNLKKNAV